ncbi:hypothetical protein C474_14024 [Halogeometricum pallidum JCM 14848]|uniref:Uncharacterized protein n=1 Tax=Halogeometricum pallidum JCM 14848 TaxID=1227487 RepID=M0D0S2_HALPD|nr:hypothetical protein [Halogeometricum pallidum]ELZ29025.1 hypothetical protein C474_14024 [Halogeometricum pallidum JCM 14848]
MQAHIFTEGSNTTAENRNRPVKEYYEGLFGMVAGLHDELAEFTDAHLHVLSETYGVIGGEEILSAVSDERQEPMRRSEMVEQAKTELLEAADDADVLVVMLSTDIFQNTAGKVWNDLVNAAKPGSIWCLSASRSSLDALEFDALEAKGCTVLTYQRVGVARIGTETREELLEAVRQKAVK